jgi:hypothetical protein
LTSSNVIEIFCSIDRNSPLSSNYGKYTSWNGIITVDLASYEGKHPKFIFNKRVRLENHDHVGHVM